MKTALYLAVAVVVSTAVLCAPNAFAEDRTTGLAAQVNQANAFLREGKLKEAIDGYQIARSIAPEDPSVLYNAGIAQYRKGDIAAAERLFQSAGGADDDAIANKARFNLGNCNYASALQLAEKDRASAIKELEKAIANYRGALDIDSSDADARANIELANKLIEKLREADKKDQQNQSEQQKQQQQRDQKNGQQAQQQSNNHPNEKSQKSKEHQQREQNQSQQPQESQSGKNEQSNAEKSKPEQNKKANKQTSKSQGDSQTNSQQSTSENRQQGAPQKNAPNDSSQVNKLNPASRHEQGARADEKNDGRSSNQESGEQQGKSPPKGTLSASGRTIEPPSKEMLEADAFDPARDGEMTRQEAEKMLQAIRDREMIRRLQRQSAERSRHVPVDRDW